MNAIEIDQVASKVNLSQSTIYKMVVEGAFPRPFPFGVSRTAWIESDVDVWLQARANIQRTPDPTRLSREDLGSASDETSPVIDQSIAIDAIAERLFAQIEARIQRAVPFEHALWSTKEIGEYLQRPAQVVRERVVCVPGFPGPIRLPNLDGGRAHPRWRAIEVVAWVESQRARKTGRPRKRDSA